MGDYLRIAKAYLTGTAAAVWCFLFVCLLAISIGEAELARIQASILSGVLSRKSYMAMFAYFNACLLGVLLRDNIAHPWASVLPHYRKKHLLITAFIALVFLGVPMFSMEFVGTSDVAQTSVAVIFLTCLAAGLWTLHHPLMAFLVLPFLAFVFVSSSSFPRLAAFLAGTSPATSAALIIISLLALWVLSCRLLTLNEDMSEYAIARVWGDFLRGRGSRGQADYLASLPADQRATFQNFDPPFSNLKQVDNLSKYSERSLWQRLQLLRLGIAPTRTSVSLAWLILLTFIGMLIPLVPARDAVVIFSVQVMTNPFNVWLFWFTGLHRLGYESLRPRTRQEFVRELGLTLLWDIVQCWLGGVLFMGIAAAIWSPELLQVKSMLLFILGTGVGQLCAYALMGIWLSKFLKRGVVANVACAFCPFMPMSIWMIETMNGHISIEVNFALASILVAASVATIALAYHRWCQVDLD